MNRTTAPDVETCGKLLLTYFLIHLLVTWIGEEPCPGSLSSERESRDSTQLSPCRTPVSRATSTKRPTASVVACTPIPPPGQTVWLASGAVNSSTATIRLYTS